MNLEKPVTFLRPPVIETILGVQFNPLPRFYNAYLGAFWKSIGDAWPNATDASALDQQFEHFGEDIAWRLAGVQLRIGQSPGPGRIQITNAERTKMVQLQNGRLHYNWLGQGGSAEYPRYESIRPEFDRMVATVIDFFKRESLGDFRPNQWEVTYINEFPHGTVWNNLDDLGEIFRFSPLPTPTNLLRLDALAGEWHYEIPPQAGRLHLELGHGKSGPKQEKEVVTFNLTARGPVNGDDSVDSLGRGLDLGHETIVRTFYDLTSDKSHAYWGLVDDHA